MSDNVEAEYDNEPNKSENSPREIGSEEDDSKSYLNSAEETDEEPKNLDEETKKEKDKKDDAVNLPGEVETEQHLEIEQDDNKKSVKSDEEIPKEPKNLDEATKGGNQDKADEEIKIKRIFSDTYVSSIYEKRPEECFSLRSIYPPCSWPSSADLLNDSDVYPNESEYDINYLNPLKDVKTVTTVGKDDSKFDLHETILYPLTEELVVEELTPGIVETKKQEYIKADTSKIFEEEKQEVETFKIIDIPYLREILELPIVEKVVKKICFAETLLISYELYNEDDKDGAYVCTPLFHRSDLLNPKSVQEMGGMSLNIESNHCSFITFCTTQFSCLGSAGASRLLSVVDHEFGLLEEKKTEWHCMHDKKVEKSLHVARDGTSFVAFRTDSEDEKIERHRGNICLNATGDLVLDGGLFALMRYLIISDFSGEFETWSMHVTGDVCRCKFTVGKKKTLFINNSPHLTIRIKKELYRDHRYPDVSKSYFLPSGHLVRHKWKGCRYFIHINPICRIPPKRHNIEYSWEDDIMLVSKYLDEKQKRRSEITTYIGDHPEIKSILQDYMLCLLQLKPDHVLDFTIDYFVNLFRE